MTLDGHGILRVIMETVSGLGVRVLDLRVTGSSDLPDGTRLQSIVLTVDGRAGALGELGDDLQDLAGVHSVVGREAGT